MADSFLAEHGYSQGTYEAQAVAQGYDLAAIKAQGFSWGNNMNPGEYQKLISQFKSPLQAQGEAAKGKLQAISSQEYAFDPNQYLPGIKQQAESIYSPQKAQLEAIRQLQSSQYEDARITTEKDFDKQLKTEIESINNRGAFFGGGAIEREQDIGDTKLRALNQLGLQAQAADFSNLAQQGILAAEESEFIIDKLFNAEASAYNRWTDQRNFSYQAALQEYQMYTDERNYARSVFESDRTYNLSVQENEENQRRFELQYDMTKDEFRRAKEEWNIDMKLKNLSYDKVLDNFKSKYDTVDYFPGLGDYKKTFFNKDGDTIGYEDPVNKQSVKTSVTFGW